MCENSRLRRQWHELGEALINKRTDKARQVIEQLRVYLASADAEDLAGRVCGCKDFNLKT